MNADGTDLPSRMRAIADQGHPRADALRKAADEFENARDQLAQPRTCDVKKVLELWVRARFIYCEVTGRPLV